jgi:hypothetical protein
MKKSILLFVFAFVIGGGVALAIRTTRHEPQPPVEPAVAIAPAALADAHSAHQQPNAPASTESTTVNTICTICGMHVDPSLPAALYEGKRVGFGCKACPPKFAADPGKYGPHALKNEITP